MGAINLHDSLIHDTDIGAWYIRVDKTLSLHRANAV